ncbi:hypothetical protein [Halorubrum ezzemoulense]|uniref:hypothetical protein n=1 Tax=Halorubrum ezzemoulense TaxID=337243 RepID=UPI00232DD767|nr:hypothetical protein [Halorubrum ezzemoulense]MDB9232841.1 hypothetical protein [Halorubrum ezzemoulense]
MSQSESGDEKTNSQELLRQEARDVIERQLNTIKQSENKASSILRINLLIFGALLTIASLILRLGDSDSFSNLTITTHTSGYLSAGIGALILSTVAAGITYTASNVYIGVSGDDLEKLSEIDSYSDLNQNLVTGYSLWVRMNQYALVKNNFLVTLTIVLIVIGVLFLGLASLAWLTQGYLGQIAVLLFGVFSFVLIVKASGLPSLGRDYWEVRSKTHETIEEYYELEQDGIGALLEGSQRRNHQSELRSMVQRAQKFEKWIAKNPDSVVGDTREIKSVKNQPSIGSGGVDYHPDILIEYADGGIAIIEAKLSDRPSTLQQGIQQLITYKQYVNDPELYLVATEIPPMIESELNEHGIQGVVPSVEFDN